MEKTKALTFNNIKPEDCVFGDSLGEGKLNSYVQARSATSKLAG